MRVDDTCGPTTGLRALFDLVAMPLFAGLGFRARHAEFDRRMARVRLETAKGSGVGLVVLPWATRPSTMWRDVASTARGFGADWCFVLAPPFLSLVDARGHAFRQSVDFVWPDALAEQSVSAFWTLAHASSFDMRAAATPIDTLVAQARLFQDQVGADLQEGVIDAIRSLGAVLPRARQRQHPAWFDEALTLVYRILFLLFAESRELVPCHQPTYRGAYALGTLCRDALDPGEAVGLWDALAAVTRLSRIGCLTDDLIVRPFNGRLFARSAAPTLERPHLSRRSVETADRDRAMQRALVVLATRPGRTGRESIAYRDLGVEQLGAVYERVLDLEEGLEANDGKVPRRSLRHSARRKETGTFYTPQPLAEFVVRRTLAPLVSGLSADAILALRVVDPAMGSGAFLVAACRYLSHAYERALVDEGRVAETDLDEDARADIRRRISECCLAGVDANPVAVQLARLSLWLATLAHGKPLGFLDHRLRVGNSLIGASPDDLRTVHLGIRGASVPLPLFDDSPIEGALGRVAGPLFELLSRRDDSVEDVRAKEALWLKLTSDRPSAGAARLRLALSLWCARWFWPHGAGRAESAPPAPAEMRAAIDALLKGDPTLQAAQLATWTRAASSLASAHRFFHWPVEFADVFYDPVGRPKALPGFDAVIGNPPWEMLRQERDRPDDARSAEPRRSPLVRFIRQSGLYPSCLRGHVNLYQPFLERALTLTRAGGRVGLVLPWGFAVDDGAAALRERLLARSSVDTIVGLDNAAGMFPIHRGLRFLVLVANPGGPAREIHARFGVRTGRELDDLPDGCELSTRAEAAYPIRLTTSWIGAVGGVARRIPDLRRPHDRALLEKLTHEHPRLGDRDGWQAEFGRELNATDDRGAFGARGLPVIDGKHVQPFVAHPESSSRRIEERLADALLPARRFARPRLAYRDVSGVANRTSLIAAIVPAGTVTTHTLFCLRTDLPIDEQHFLCGFFNSYVLNAVVRLLMGGHLTTSLVEGLPVPRWRGTGADRRIARLARRLAVRPHAADVRARLEAAVARRYGLDRSTFGSVLETFPLVAQSERRQALNAFAL
jgi:hypothetical protein